MKYKQFLTACKECNNATSRKFARANNGLCKQCATGGADKRRAAETASCEEQRARYLDCGPQNWDDN